MDLKIFFTTFFMIFFAELADKTQLVGIGMASKTGKPLAVFLGSVTGYIVVTALSIVLGLLIHKYVKQDIVRYISAFLFVAIGVLMLFKKI